MEFQNKIQERQTNSNDSNNTILWQFSLKAVDSNNQNQGKVGEDISSINRIPLTESKEKTLI